MYSASEKQILQQFGQRVRELREKMGLSQETMAYEAGVDRSFVGKVERGDNNVSLLKMARLAKVLNVSLVELLIDVVIPDDLLDAEPT